MTSNFNYRVVFFHQKMCVACNAMRPIWNQVKLYFANNYEDLNVGFGEWDVNQDDWEFLDLIEGDGTPNFAVFNSDKKLIGLNTEGMLAESKLVDFILQSINADAKN